jgi:uncharacterized protein DUF1844
VADQKQDETFRVVDRRLFTPEGDLRQEIVEQERQDALEEEKKKTATAAAPASAPAGPVSAAAPEARRAPAPPASPQGVTTADATAPIASRGFQVLIDFLAGNAAARLGMLPDPRTGEAYIDLESANELIDMLDALREKTRGNLANEEEQLLLEVLRSLKLSYLEMTKATAQAMKEEAAKRKA